MDKKFIGILAGGILLTIALLFVDIYIAGFVFVVVVTIVMSLLIMQDTTFRPQIAATLSEDAKTVVLTNSGNSPAVKIHVALVPMNIEYDLPSLAVDESHEHPFSSMIEEVKVVVSYENVKGQRFSGTERLSSSDRYDPFKPVIPMFGWK